MLYSVWQGVNGTSSDVETCLSTVPLFIKEAGLDPRLRYDTLCQVSSPHTRADTHT